MTEQNIVILGASYSGIQTAHYVLKHVLPKIPSTSQKYRVYLINASKEFFHIVTGPRAIVSEELIPPAQAFASIPDAFSGYDASIFSFIEATVTNVDTSNRTIQYRAKKQVETSLPYHALVIATGAKPASPLFAISPSVDRMRVATQEFRSALSTARSIVIGGGGPIGVETAGELAEYFNAEAESQKGKQGAEKAEVLLIASSDRLLPHLREDVSAAAAKYLTRLGVTIRYNTKVLSTEPHSSSTTDSSLSSPAARTNVSISLDTSETIQADIYIPATGSKPNASFLPASLLTATGHVQTNPSTLRVDLAGPRVYAVGDASSASPGGIYHLGNMVPVVATNLKRDLVAAAAGKSAPDTGKDRTFEKGSGVSQFVPVGKNKGVGQLFGYWAPSFAVWLLKGRDYMLSKTMVYVDGSSVAKESVWKFE